MVADPERRRSVDRRVAAAIGAFIRAGDRGAARRLAEQWLADFDEPDLDGWGWRIRLAESRLRRAGAYELVRYDDDGLPL